MTELPKKITDDPYGAAILIRRLVAEQGLAYWRRYLLAFVYGYLGEHDLLSVRTDAEKFLLLGALNLVECVAFVGATTAT